MYFLDLQHTGLEQLPFQHVRPIHARKHEHIKRELGAVSNCAYQPWTLWESNMNSTWLIDQYCSTLMAVYPHAQWHMMTIILLTHRWRKQLPSPTVLTVFAIVLELCWVKCVLIKLANSKTKYCHANVHYIIYKCYRRILHTCPPFLHASIGQNREGAYAWDNDILCHNHYRVTIAMWACDVRTFTGCLMDKIAENRQSKPWYDTSSYCTNYSYGVQIARFHSQSRREAYGRDKYTCEETLARNGRGLMREGGRMGGILRHFLNDAHHWYMHRFDSPYFIYSCYKPLL